MSKLVVVVDTQVDFMLPSGKLYVPGAEALIGPMFQYISTLPPNTHVLFLMDTHYESDYPTSDEALLYPLHCVKDSVGWSNVIPRNMVPNTCTTEAQNKSFTDPWLERHKRLFALADKHDTIEIIGVAADVCVKETAKGFGKRGFPYRVIGNLTVGIKENPYE